MWLPRGYCHRSGDPIHYNRSIYSSASDAIAQLSWLIRTKARDGTGTKQHTGMIVPCSHRDRIGDSDHERRGWNARESSNA